MSDELVAASVPDAGVQDLTAGMLLRRAREATGLHVAALAVSMKVPVKKLEALEADRLDELPDAVFVRALAASVCRSLKIDPAPILAKLPQSVMPKLAKDERGINMPVPMPGLRVGQSMAALLTRPAALWVLGLLVAALVVVFFPESRSTVHLPEAVAPVQPPAPALPAANGSEAALPLNTPAQLAPAIAAAVSAPAPVASAAPAAALQASVPADAEVVVFKVNAKAWVRVLDAKGVVQFEKTLAAGEAGAAGGLLPLSVVVGNVGATEVLVRGQAFGLEPFTKDNVARFEVK